MNYKDITNKQILEVFLNLFVAILILTMIPFDCSEHFLLFKSSKCMDGLIINSRNSNLSHIDTSTQFTSTERDSLSTSMPPQQQPKNSSQSLIHVFSSDNKSSIGSLPTPNTVRILELVVYGSGEYDYLDEFLASHKFFEIIMVSLRSKHPSQNSNNSFDENDSSGSNSSVPPTFKLSGEKIEQASRTEENRTLELFNCSDISLDVTDQDDIQMKNLKLKIKHLSRPGVTFTVCRIVKEEKVTQTYPTKLGIMMFFFTYIFVSQLCAWAFILSVPEFGMLYIVLNIITYFLICMMLAGSITGVNMYFLPFHLNFMFILVTSWITLMSCKFVCRQLKKFKFFRIANGNVVGNVFRMFLLTMAISLFMLLMAPDTIQEMTSFALSNNCILEQEVHCKWMSNFNCCIVFAFDLVTANFFYRFYQREKLKEIKNPGVHHTDHYEMYYFYNMFSVVSWIFGFLVISFLSAFPEFWYLYLFVTILLPFSCLSGSMETHTVKVKKVHVTGNGKPETIRQV